eukprot:350551-Prorocentrum_minimum.AAC.1
MNHWKLARVRHILGALCHEDHHEHLRQASRRLRLLRLVPCARRHGRFLRHEHRHHHAVLNRPALLCPFVFGRPLSRHGGGTASVLDSLLHPLLLAQLLRHAGAVGKWDGAAHELLLPRQISLQRQALHSPEMPARPLPPALVAAPSPRRLRDIKRCRVQRSDELDRDDPGETRCVTSEGCVLRPEGQCSRRQSLPKGKSNPQRVHPVEKATTNCGTIYRTLDQTLRVAAESVTYHDRRRGGVPISDTLDTLVGRSRSTHRSTGLWVLSPTKKAKALFAPARRRK